MAELIPFKGIRYNTQKVRIEEVITEPYDRIPPQLQEEYYQRSPYNIVRIILGKDADPEHHQTDKYKSAKLYLDDWLQKGILLKDVQASFYLYEQEFCLDGESKKRLGLIACVKLEEFDSKKVLPHEKTFPKHKIDRLNLLRATNTNTEQIFLLYTDDNRRVSNILKAALGKAELGASAEDEDHFSHRLWVIKDKETIREIQDEMKDKVLVIADGHHRYETSLNYRREILDNRKVLQKDDPVQYVMMTLFKIDDPGLVILPTYRLVRNLDKLTENRLKGILSPTFEISEINWTDTSDRSILENIKKKVSGELHTFAAFARQFKKFLLFRLKSKAILDTAIKEKRSREWKHLDVAILHSLIIDKLKGLSTAPFSLENNVSYIRNLEEGIQKVKDGEFQMIFLLKPASLSQIREVVENGELMPQKSTDFFPKLKSGLVMNPLDD